MGRSAKLHKRVHKPANAASTSQATSQVAHRKTSSVPASSKKRKDLKSKSVRQIKEEGKSGVLGGADYVTLMLGSRRRAKEEAKKLPPPEGDLSSLSL